MTRLAVKTTALVGAVEETGTGRWWLESDGVICTTILPGITRTLNVDDVIENHQAIKKVSGGVLRPILCDLDGMPPTTKAHRDYAAGPEAAKYIMAIAILVRSPVSRMFGNFFIKVNHPLFPTRLFSSEREARSWLYGFLVQE